MDEELLAGLLEDDDVSGEIMGELMGDYDVDGFDVVGAAARRRAKKKALARRLKLPQKPGWRNQLAPGVIQPDEGMVPLPLSPNTNNGIFAAGGGTIIFSGQLQKPYRPERLLVSAVRTGASATGRLLGQLFVGTDLQQADISGFDVEIFGNPTAFGTRLTCKAAEPGVLIRLLVTPTSFPTGTDTILLTCSFAGRVVH